MLLRSNNLYFPANFFTMPVTDTSVPTSSTNTMTTTTSTNTMSTTTSVSPCIKLLHQDPGLRRFSGEDPMYSASSFIQQAEDAMRNSNVTTNADKISFVRSQLTPNSLASDLMLASHFRPDLLNYDYDKFKLHFLNIFGACQRDDSLQFPFRLAESLTTQLGSVGHLRGQARASEIADDAITALKDKWAVNGAVPLDKLRTVLEVLFYVQYLTPAERRMASSLTLKPVDSFYDFSTKLSKKLTESPKVPPPSAASVAPVSARAPVSLPTASQQQPQLKRSSRTCSYCSKDGHTSRFCFQKKRDAREGYKTAAPTASTPPKDVSAASSPTKQPVTSSKPAPVAQQSQTSRSLKYCVVHEHGNHTTDECFSILRLKNQNFPQRPSPHAPS